MTIAILAGGPATRLRPLTDKIPKALLEVNGEPFIAHQLRLLRANGAQRVVICAGYLGDQLQAAVGNGSAFGVDVHFSFDGPELLGTGGAVKKALPILGDSFFVLYGDSYLPCDYRAIADAFRGSGRVGMMTVFRNQGRWDTSNVEMGAGAIVAYDKVRPTPRMQYIDYGLGAFRSSAFAALAPGVEYDLAGVYRQLLSEGELAAFEVTERFYEIGSLSGLKDLRAFLGERR